MKVKEPVLRKGLYVYNRDGKDVPLVNNLPELVKLLETMRDDFKYPLLAFLFAGPRPGFTYIVATQEGLWWLGSAWKNDDVLAEFEGTLKNIARALWRHASSGMSEASPDSGVRHIAKTLFNRLIDWTKKALRKRPPIKQKVKEAIQKIKAGHGAEEISRELLEASVTRVADADEAQRLIHSLLGNK